MANSSISPSIHDSPTSSGVTARRVHRGDRNETNTSTNTSANVTPTICMLSCCISRSMSAATSWVEAA